MIFSHMTWTFGRQKTHSSIKESNAAESEYGIFIWCSKHLTLGRGRQLIIFIFHFCNKSFRAYVIQLRELSVRACCSRDKHGNFGFGCTGISSFNDMIKAALFGRFESKEKCNSECKIFCNARLFETITQYIRKQMQAWSAGLQRQLVQFTYYWTLWMNRILKLFFYFLAEIRKSRSHVE